MFSELLYQEDSVEEQKQSIRAAAKGLSSSAIIEQRAAINGLRYYMGTASEHAAVILGVEALGSYVNGPTPAMNFENTPITEDMAYKVMIDTGKEHSHPAVKQAVISQFLNGLFGSKDHSGQRHTKLSKGIAEVLSTCHPDTLEKPFIHTVGEKLEIFSSNGAHPEAKHHAIVAQEFVRSRVKPKLVEVH